MPWTAEPARREWEPTAAPGTPEAAGTPEAGDVPAAVVAPAGGSAPAVGPETELPGSAPAVAPRRLRIERPRPLGYRPDPPASPTGFTPVEGDRVTRAAPIPADPTVEPTPGAGDPVNREPAGPRPERAPTVAPALRIQSAVQGRVGPGTAARYPVFDRPTTGSSGSGQALPRHPRPMTPVRPAGERPPGGVGINSRWTADRPAQLETLQVTVDRELRDRIHADALPYLPQTESRAGAEQVRGEATAVLARAVTGYRRTQVDAGQTPLDADTEQQIIDAVLDLVYGVGPLQELFDLGEDVEDIHICGWDDIVVSRNSGMPARVPPVVGSDQELVDAVNALASRYGRQFSTAHPTPTFSVPELSARVTASMDVSLRPYVVIRRHPAAMRASTLEDLVELGTFDQPVADFLRAAVRAKRNILFGGVQNTGKTTTMRAASLECGLTEVIGTLESDKELYLERLMPQHGFVHTVKTFTAREANSDGSGQISLDDLTPHMLRKSLNRLIVGEVRGNEALAMLDAAQSNAGTMGTVHGRSPQDAMARFIGLVARAGLTEDRAQDMVRRNVDLLVYSQAVDNRLGGGRIERFVSHVLEVTVGDGFAPHYNEVFAPGPDGRATHKATPACLEELVAVGYDSPTNWWGAA